MTGTMTEREVVRNDAPRAAPASPGEVRALRAASTTWLRRAADKTETAGITADDIKISPQLARFLADQLEKVA
jgi:hypothetical protein